MIRNCLSGRNVLEKRLIFVVVGLSLVLVCCIISLIVVTLPKKASLGQKKNVCETERCKAAGEDVFASIDGKLDPCQDFYSFACNGWKSGHDASVEVTTPLRDDALQTAMAILHDTRQAKVGSKALKNAIDFYRMCNNATRINQRGLNPIRRSLEGLGGWPAIEYDWNSTSYDWMAAEVQTLTRTGYSVLVGFTITPDPQNASNLMVQLGAINVRGNTDSPEYSNSIRNILSYFDDRMDYEEDIGDIIQLEINLTKSYDAVQELLANMTVAQLVQETGLNWEKYLQLLTNGTSVSVTNDTMILTDKFAYLKSLGQILRQSTSRTIANLLGWKFLSYNWFLLPDALISQFEPRADLSLRKAVCFDFVQNTFRDVLSHVYVKNYFQIPTKEKSQGLMKILLEEFLKMINQTEWLDDRTKSLALKKARAIRFHSAYPDWVIDATNVEENYKNMREIDADREDALETHSMLSKFNVGNIVTAVTSTRGIFVNPFEVNAYYKRSTNEFAVSAAMLKPPFYHDQNPWYLNIGALGSVIGHEITHGFDGQGRKYDESAIRRSWWNETTVEEFLRRAECFAKQYQKYGVSGFSNKQSEIIADNGGIRIAFKTYKSLQPKEDLILPGFEDFTQDQLFFIAYGMTQCSNGANGESVTEQYSYAPNRYRVNIPLQNMKEFADAFNCDWSSSMNPREKCLLW